MQSKAFNLLMHVALLRQGLGSHKLAPFSQKLPIKPPGHMQLKIYSTTLPSIVSGNDEHVPSLRQGEVKHGSKGSSHKGPVRPGGQVQSNPNIDVPGINDVTVQVPPSRHGFILQGFVISTSHVSPV